MVNHIDGNKYNNTISNLEWCTSEYNINHMIETGLSSQAKRVICNETGEIFSSMSRADKHFGWGCGTVSYLIHRPASHDGLTFRIL